MTTIKLLHRTREWPHGDDDFIAVRPLPVKETKVLTEPACFTRKCKHYIGIESDGDEGTERILCHAFPDAIPNDITYGDNLHLTPIKGDNGIQYERADNESTE